MKLDSTLVLGMLASDVTGTLTGFLQHDPTCNNLAKVLCKNRSLIKQLVSV